jgi:aminoglycoside phosphotransferase (APT) family kinase protein
MNDDSMRTVAAPPADPIEKIAEGREAEIFAWQPGTVLRLLRDSGGRARLEREAAAMEAALACGVPVPAVRGFAEAMGRDGMVMDRVDGIDLLTEIGKQPWRLFRAARITGDLHARVHDVIAPDGLPDLREDCRRRIERAGMPADLTSFALQTLDALPDGDRLCHGDYHPGNVIDTPTGPVIIDWPNVTRGDPDADYARTLLLLRLGEPPPGAPFVIRYLTGVARGRFAAGYRRAYAARRTPDATAVERWLVVRAADRLVNDIASEREKLLAIVEDARTTRLTAGS